MLERLQTYINNRIALIRIEIIEKTSQGFTFLFVAMVLTLLFTLFLFFLSLAAALFVGAAIGSLGLGFAIVAVFYLLVFLIALIFKHSFIEKPALNFSIKYLFSRHNEDEEDENTDQ